MKRAVSAALALVIAAAMFAPAQAQTIPARAKAVKCGWQIYICEMSRQSYIRAYYTTSLIHTCAPNTRDCSYQGGYRFYYWK